MSDSLEVIKSAVRNLKAYTLSPHRASIKLNQNENPWDVTPEIKAETLRRLKDRKWSRYPDFVPASLQERLAKFASWAPDGVIAGNGSNELIQALLMVTINDRKRVLIAEPTFALYRQITRVLGGDVISVPLTDQFRFDVETIVKQTDRSNVDVVILCSPNNPTGCVIRDEDLRRLLRVAPGLVVIDEAYHEFAQHSVVPLLNEFDNLVVLRTFSKAMGLAALRVGYLLAAPTLVTEIRKGLLPYNLNAFSQTAAEVCIEMYDSELLPTVRRITGERERVFSALSELDGFVPIASQSNFMIVRTQIPPKSIFSDLLKHDILVRDVSSYPMLENYFRVNVGTPTENDALIKALQEIAAAVKL